MRSWHERPDEQRLADGVGAHSLPVAVGQLTPGAQDPILQGGFGAAGLVWQAGAVRPIDAIEPLAPGALHPADDGGGTHAKLPRRRPRWLALAHGGYHGPTALLLALCLLMGLPRKGSVFGELQPSAVRNVLAENCSERIGTYPFKKKKAAMNRRAPNFALDKRKSTTQAAQGRHFRQGGQTLSASRRPVGLLPPGPFL